MKAFILAGGFGNKLREIIYNQPKILAPVKGQPFIDHLFYLLKKNNFTEVVLGLGYLGDSVRDYVTHRHLYDLSVFYAMESRPLGTGGSFKNAEKFLDTTFFAINGDTYLDMDYSKALEFHKEKNAKVTIIVAKKRYPGNFNGVEIIEDGKVAGVAPHTDEDMVHAGIYIMEPTILSNIPLNYRFSFEKEVLPGLIEQGCVYAYKTDSTFFDIGDAEGYKLAQSELER